MTNPTPAERVIRDAAQFWQEVHAERAGIESEDAVMSKRYRPMCQVAKPHIYKRGGMPFWVCKTEAFRGAFYLACGKTPQQALGRLHTKIYLSLNHNLIQSANFLYIDSMIMFTPPGVFDLLPQEIRDYYEPLEPQNK